MARGHLDGRPLRTRQGPTNILLILVQCSRRRVSKPLWSLERIWLPTGYRGERGQRSCDERSRAHRACLFRTKARKPVSERHINARRVQVALAMAKLSEGGGDSNKENEVERASSGKFLDCSVRGHLRAHIRLMIGGEEIREEQRGTERLNIGTSKDIAGESSSIMGREWRSFAHAATVAIDNTLVACTQTGSRKTNNTIQVQTSKAGQTTRTQRMDEPNGQEKGELCINLK